MWIPSCFSGDLLLHGQICFICVSAVIPKLKMPEHLNFVVNTKSSNKQARMFSKLLRRNRHSQWPGSHLTEKGHTFSTVTSKAWHPDDLHCYVLITVCHVSFCFSRVSLSWFLSFVLFYLGASLSTSSFSFTGHMAACDMMGFTVAR